MFEGEQNGAQMSPEDTREYRQFIERVRERLDKAQGVYGSTNFSGKPELLVHELQQEALDLAGWGFILWKRLEAAKMALRKSLGGA